MVSKTFLQTSRIISIIVTNQFLYREVQNMKSLKLVMILVAISMICLPNLSASTLPFEEGAAISNPQIGGEDPFQIQTTIPAIVQEVEEIGEEIKKLFGDKDASNQEKVEKAAKIIKHTVESGDSLWAIAKKLLGDGSRYREIIEANKDKFPSLEKNPDLILSGWELEIPQDEETSEGGGTTTGLTSDDDKDSKADVNKDSSSSAAQVSQLPNWSLREKIDRLQKAVDSANRKLLSQNKRIASLNVQTIKFLIDNKFMTDEEWMAMNPPVGYTYRLDRLGKIELVNSKNEPMSSADIAKMDKMAKDSKAKAEKEAKAAEEAKTNEDEDDKNSIKDEKPADKKEDKKADDKDEDKKIEEEAKKAADSRYQKMLSEMGMPDVSDGKTYRKAVSAGSKLLSKGFFGGTTAFKKFVNPQDYPYHNISDLQRELKSLQGKYEKQVRENKTSRFLGIFGSTIESTGKRIMQIKEKLKNAWEDMEKALEASKAKATELEATVKSEKATITSLQKELDSMDIYDSSNSKKVQEKMKAIKDSKKKVEDAQEKLGYYDQIRQTFKI